MNGNATLFRIFGIEIRIHYSWWLIFILLTWSLATAFFPVNFPVSKMQAWILGLVSALLLFLSVLLHELSHSLVAKAKKIRVENITLFFFGGVAGITEEDMPPASEFVMAVAGPLFSLFLSGLFYILFRANIHLFVTAAALYLYQINFMLAVFNLLPGFPLDGGRAFRALLFSYYHDLEKATRIAANVGRALAGALFVIGMINLFRGSGNSLWLILIGGFLYFIAGVSYEQVLIKKMLAPISLRELLIKIPVLNPELRLQEFAVKWRKSENSLFLVKNKTFAGILEINQLQSFSPKLQEAIKVKNISKPLETFPRLQKNETAYKAFQILSKQSGDALPLFEKNHFIGMVTRQQLQRRLQWELKFRGKS